MDHPATVQDLCRCYTAWAESYYRDRSGNLTRESHNCRDAARALLAVAGTKCPQDLTAADLEAAQAWMVQQRLSRTTINARINRLRRMAKWAAKPPRRWITLEQLTDWSLVDPLKRWRTDAPESAGVKPVSWEDVVSVISHAGLQLATALEIHWLTGMRSGELVNMRRDWLNRQQDVYLYEPTEHKTAHHNIRRIIALGPMAAKLLDSWLSRIPAAQVKIWTYSTAQTYRQEIQKIQKRHDLTRWTPSQIRHSFATRMRAAAGLDAAQIALGHQNSRTTEIYAEPDLAAALAAIRRLG